MSWLPFCLSIFMFVLGCGPSTNQTGTSVPAPDSPTAGPDQPPAGSAKPLASSNQPPRGSDGSTPETPDSEQPVGIVTVVVDTDDGSQTFEVPNVEAGSTVEDVMRSLKGIDVVLSGFGESAFVERIGDIETSPTAGWLYRIDGELATQGVGSMIVNPPATLRWSYSDME